MNTITIAGLNGDQPIGFLAALGMLRILSRNNPNTRMGWTEVDASWCPYFARESTELSLDCVAEELSAALQALSTEGDHGVAHFGDKIGVDPSVFRSHAQRSVTRWIDGARQDSIDRDDPSLVSSMMVAMGCDVVLDGNEKVANTPLSFSNGASGQYLLKDFREAASLCTDDRIKGTLEGTPELHQITSLNWDPRDQRAAAHRWIDPATDNAEVDPGINALAFIGLSYFPAIPGSKITSVGWAIHDERRGLRWPIWEPLLSSPSVSATMACFHGPDAGLRSGIIDVRFSAVVNPDGKRNYFSPARSVL